MAKCMAPTPGCKFKKEFKMYGTSCCPKPCNYVDASGKPCIPTTTPRILDGFKPTVTTTPPVTDGFSSPPTTPPTTIDYYTTTPDDSYYTTTTKPKLCICNRMYKPVCGVDGKTYGNPCHAKCKNVDVEHDGRCGDTKYPTTTGFKIIAGRSLLLSHRAKATAQVSAQATSRHRTWLIVSCCTLAGPLDRRQQLDSGIGSG